ncbi:MAG: DinB family protein [Saprospiraceae bacterium]
MQRPKKNEYAPFHAAYLQLLPPRSGARTLLRKGFREARDLLLSIPESKGDYAYAPGKWTVKQVIMHLIDTERVFAYRILCFLRKDRIALPGFNQNFWAEEYAVEGRSIRSLLQEWKVVRDNTLFLLEQCTPDREAFVGTASGLPVSARAYFYVIAGHQISHLNTLKERYL